MQTLVSLAVTGIIVLAGTALVSQTSVAADSRTPEQCGALFNQLNVSGTGKLTAKEAATDPVSSKAFGDPEIQKKGYLTQDEFKSLCASDSVEATKSP